MLTFNKKYLLIAVFLFIIEVLIALYVKDAIIRPYVGDFLVVILLYCMVRTVVDAPVMKIAVAVLLFAYLIEGLQYMNVIQWLGLQHNKAANIIIGNRFEWIDMLAYTLGVICIVLVERAKGDHVQSD